MQKKQSNNLILKYIYLLIFSVSVISLSITIFLWLEYKTYSDNSIAVTEYHIASIQYIDNMIGEIENTRFWFGEYSHNKLSESKSTAILPHQNQINKLIRILTDNMQNILQTQIKFKYSKHEAAVLKAQQQYINISDYLNFLSLMEKKGDIARFDHQLFDKTLMPLSMSLLQLKKLHSFTYKQLIDINSKKNLNDIAFILFLLITLIFIASFLAIKIMSIISKLLLQQAISKKSLFDSENRYRSFIESSKDWVWESDQNGMTTYSNSAVINILGYHPDELIGKPSFLFMHYDNQAEIKDMLPDCIALKTGWNNKLSRWKNKQGEWRFLESSSNIVFDNDGNFSGFRGVDRDVTPRILAEQANKKSQQTLINAFDATPDCISITRMSDGVFVYANPALVRISKFSIDDLIDTSLLELNIYHNLKDRDALIRKLMKHHTVSDFHIEFQCKDGEMIPASVSCSIMEMDGEKYIITILRDISERLHSQQELKKLSTALEQSHDAIYIADTNGIIEYVNPRLIELTGYSSKELVGEKPNVWKSEDTPEEIYIDLWKTIIHGDTWKGDILNKKKNGKTYWSSDTISPIVDNKGHTTHFLGTQEDVTEIRNLNQQLTWQASYDYLTGLVNRREFERRLDRIAINSSRYDEEEHALFFMDLDQFQVVNDTCGHIAGDELLRQLSDILQSVVRKRDTLARIGGDEFAVLMEHCSLDHAYRVANDILEAVQEYQFQWNRQMFRVGVSIGLIPITHYNYSSTELLKQADNACYIAKEQGRNRIHVYTSNDKDIALRDSELSWVAKLYQALDENRFCLYIQTIAPLAHDHQNENMSYEILLRMIDTAGNIINPEQFIPAAERFNIVTKLDQWMVENVFESLRRYPDFLIDVEFICLNLSGFSLTENSFLDFIIDHLQENKNYIDPTKICFEITETAAITNLSLATKFISTLKGMGCQFALDDFGSGLSSFGYLKNLSVDYLKIDGMFVKDIIDDQIDHAIVKSINDIGHVMKMKTIAEYAENDEIKGMLREIGIDYAQGYGIDRPTSLDELLKKHAKKNSNVVKLEIPDKSA